MITERGDLIDTIDAYERTLVLMERVRDGQADATFAGILPPRSWMSPCDDWIDRVLRAEGPVARLRWESAGWSPDGPPAYCVVCRLEVSRWQSSGGTLFRLLYDVRRFVISTLFEAVGEDCARVLQEDLWNGEKAGIAQAAQRVQILPNPRFRRVALWALAYVCAPHFRLLHGGPSAVSDCARILEMYVRDVTSAPAPWTPDNGSYCDMAGH